MWKLFATNTPYCGEMSFAIVKINLGGNHSVDCTHSAAINGACVGVQMVTVLFSLYDTCKKDGIIPIF